MIPNLIAVLAVACYELGTLLVDIGTALGALDGQETEDRCPATVPEYLTSPR